MEKYGLLGRVWWRGGDFGEWGGSAWRWGGGVGAALRSLCRRYLLFPRNCATEQTIAQMLFVAQPRRICIL